MVWLSTGALTGVAKSMLLTTSPCVAANPIFSPSRGLFFFVSAPSVCLLSLLLFHLCCQRAPTLLAPLAKGSNDQQGGYNDIYGYILGILSIPKYAEMTRGTPQQPRLDRYPPYKNRATGSVKWHCRLCRGREPRSPGAVGGTLEKVSIVYKTPSPKYLLRTLLSHLHTYLR